MCDEEISRVTNTIPATEEDPTNTFGAIAYDGATTADYYYTVQEANIPSEATAENNYTVDGITYDPTIYDVKVSVTKDNSGIPTVEVYTKKSTEAETAYAKTSRTIWMPQ